MISSKKGVFKVTDTQNPVGNMIIHEGQVEVGELKVGQKIRLEVDATRRKAIARAHSATHILQWALRDVLGEHIKQAGSLVGADRFRFDFSHFKAMTKKEIQRVENLVNEKILSAGPVRCYSTTIDYAKEIGEVALFGEK